MQETVTPPSTAATSTPPPPVPPRPAVLYVDDEEQALKYFPKVLAKGFEVLTANSAASAITVLEAHGERIGVLVSDQRMPGRTGVKAADLPRLLEPFFTTKDVGEGTGLGLSICHTIIKNHGGRIVIESEEGQWTKVTFDLPLSSSGFSKSLADESETTSAFKDSSPQTTGSIAA